MLLSKGDNEMKIPKYQVGQKFLDYEDGVCYEILYISPEAGRYGEFIYFNKEVSDESINYDSCVESYFDEYCDLIEGE